MAIDVFKPRGKLKKSQPGAGVASVIQVPILCTVMSTVDPTHQGRIAVYPSENNNNPGLFPREVKSGNSLFTF